MQYLSLTFYAIVPSKVNTMKSRIRVTLPVLLLLLVGAPVVAAATKKGQKTSNDAAAKPDPQIGAEETSKPEPPKITHENLYQMEELVKQGADPNAHYFLYPGLP